MVSIVITKYDEDGGEGIEGEEEADAGEGQWRDEPLYQNLVSTQDECHRRITHGCGEAVGRVEGARCPKQVIY